MVEADKVMKGEGVERFSLARHLAILLPITREQKKDYCRKTMAATSCFIASINSHI